MKNVAIVGAGAAGCICAYHLIKGGFKITLFDKNLPLRTLLPTGGERCNLAHSEFDFKELAKNYPRGEKFLYSVFSQFSTADTIDMFQNMGIKTYIQQDGRIFPTSDSAQQVQETILKELRKYDVKFVQEEIKDCKLLLDNYQSVVLAIGGHSGYDIFKPLGIKITDIKPSLVGLNTQENFKTLSGTVIKNAVINEIKGDLLFTHFGISGPLTYTISSYNAFTPKPYNLKIDLCADIRDLQDLLNKNPKKEIKNLLGKYIPQKVVKYILDDIDENTICCNINRISRDLILDRIHNFNVTVTGTNKGEETVTAGGVDLNEINPKTMETKKIPNLYCIGEVLNIDGLCGGFNLQNAWSTAYVCAQGIMRNN